MDAIQTVVNAAARRIEEARELLGAYRAEMSDGPAPDAAGPANDYYKRLFADLDEAVRTKRKEK